MAVVLKLPATIIKAEKTTDEICTLTLKPHKLFPAFKPGQFLHLAIDNYDPSYPWPESRVFSIASSPARKDIIRITFIIKGVFTRRMYNELKENDIVWLKLPYGEFTFDESISSVFIAGGTGITPFIAFLESISEKKTVSASIQLHYGIREPGHMLYQDLLQKCTGTIDGFRQFIYIENPGLFTDKDIIAGRIDIEKIYSLNQDKDVIYYLSGPNEMIKSFRHYMRGKGVNASQIKSDEWM